MPIQAEATTGRPSRGLVGPVDDLDLSRRLKTQIGAWSDYNERERRVLQQYSTAFSETLRGQGERMTSQAGEVKTALGGFWSARDQARYFERRWREEKVFDWNPFGGSFGWHRKPELKERHEKWRGRATEALGRAEGLREIPFEETKWQPQPAGPAPATGSVLFGTGLRSMTSPQVRATTTRPGRPPSGRGLRGLLAEEETSAQLGKKQTELRQQALRVRRGLSETYGPLATKQAEEYRNIQDEIDRALAAARKVRY